MLNNGKIYFMAMLGNAINVVYENFIKVFPLQFGKLQVELNLDKWNADLEFHHYNLRKRKN